jgi:hypothetical protein
MTVAINKDGYARIIIMRPATILHQRPHTFSQTASRPIEFLALALLATTVEAPLKLPGLIAN